MRRLLLLGLCALVYLLPVTLTAQPRFTELFTPPIPAEYPETALLTDSASCGPDAGDAAATLRGFIATWTDHDPGAGEPRSHLRLFDPQGAARSPQRDFDGLTVDDPLVAVGGGGFGHALFDRPGSLPHVLWFFDPQLDVYLETEIEAVGTAQDLVALPTGAVLLVEDNTPTARILDGTGVIGTVDLSSGIGDVNRFLLWDRPGDRGFWHAYLANLPVSPPAFGVFVRPRLEDGTPAGDLLVDVFESGVADQLAVARDDRGRGYLVWNTPESVQLQRFDAAGPLEDPITVASGFPVGEIHLTSDAEGNLLITFEDLSPLDDHDNPSVVRARSVLADGTFAGPVRPVAVPAGPSDSRGFAGGSSALAAPGLAQVLVRSTDPRPLDPAACADGGPLTSVPVRMAGERHLLLRQGRFRVEVDWQDPFNGGTGIGRAVPGTEDAGSFWFFRPDTKEIEVKVLDGRTINGNFWVFAAGLSNVGYTITVTDQRTGFSETYVNPPRDFGNFIDTTSFPDVPAVPEGDAALNTRSEGSSSGDLGSVLLPGFEVSGARLSGPAACSPYGPSLARTPYGFVTAYGNEITPLLRGYGTQRPAVTPEGRLRGRLGDQAIATAPNGSGVVVNRTAPQGETFAQFFGPAGRLLPLRDRNLGTISSTTGDLRLGLIRLDDGSYLLSTNEPGQDALRFDASGVIDRFRLRSPDVVQVGNELWAATFGGFVTSPPSAGVFVTRYDLDGRELGEAYRFTEQGDISDVELVVDALDRPTLVWAATRATRLQRFNADGSANGDVQDLAIRAGFEELETIERLKVTTDPEGNLLVTWRTGFLDGDRGRLFSLPHLADGTRLGPFRLLADLDLGGNGQVFDHDVVVSSAGAATLAVTVPEGELGSLGDCDFTRGLFGYPRKLGGERSLLLREGRFRVEVDWTDPFNGGSGIGHAVPGTEDAGSFWFFDSLTKEIEIKILDGRTVNGHFWVFAAGLSNVGYRIAVTDQRTGQTKTYVNPPREFGNFIDTTFFTG